MKRKKNGKRRKKITATTTTTTTKRQRYKKKLMRDPLAILSHYCKWQTCSLLFIFKTLHRHLFR